MRATQGIHLMIHPSFLSLCIGCNGINPLLKVSIIFCSSCSCWSTFCHCQRLMPCFQRSSPSAHARSPSREIMIVLVSFRAGKSFVRARLYQCAVPVPVSSATWSTVRNNGRSSQFLMLLSDCLGSKSFAAFGIPFQPLSYPQY